MTIFEQWSWQQNIYIYSIYIICVLFIYTFWTYTVYGKYCNQVKNPMIDIFTYFYILRLHEFVLMIFKLILYVCVYIKFSSRFNFPRACFSCFFDNNECWQDSVQILLSIELVFCEHVINPLSQKLHSFSWKSNNGFCI